VGFVPSYSYVDEANAHLARTKANLDEVQAKELWAYDEAVAGEEEEDVHPGWRTLLRLLRMSPLTQPLLVPTG